ncbi:hypothetical protein [Streptomyces sp. NPDC101234]|uniref:hypothetical protein n=1 Tax=Streptomyces sp. NPDC101234 TaxID=3366138 RepID=UPI003822A707
MQVARHRQEDHRAALIGDAVAVLKDAQEVLCRSPDVVTDVDTDTYRGKASVTPEAMRDALFAWQDQLTAMLSPCKHDTLPGDPLDLETGRARSSSNWVRKAAAVIPASRRDMG